MYFCLVNNCLHSPRRAEHFDFRKKCRTVKEMLAIREQIVDFGEKCRICGSSNQDVANIFHTVRRGLTIAKMLSFCLQKKVHSNDGRPAIICFICIPRLVEAFEFLMTAKKSDEYFQRVVLSVATVAMTEAEEILVETQAEQLTDDHHGSAKECDVEMNETRLTKPTEDILAHEDQDSQKNTARQAEDSPPLNQPTKTLTKPLYSNSKPVFTQMPFECHICGERYRAKCDFDKHLCRGDEIACEYCPEKCRSISEIMAHLDVHKDEFRHYKCSACKKSFNLMALCTLHDKQHEKYEFSCGVCNKKFRRKNSLNKHRRAHSNERPYLCAECGKGFKTESCLKTHQLVHSEERPFACSQCSAKFRILGLLKKHLDTHNSDQKHVCCECQKTYKTNASLRMHQMRHREPTKECEVCSMKFFGNDSLKVHMRKHTGEKLKCKYCPSTYSQYNDLIRHLRTHVGENTYKCKTCEKTFRYRTELKWHQNECSPSADQLNESDSLAEQTMPNLDQ